MGAQQAKLAVESRGYPLFRYNPDNGKTPAECFDLEGNPNVEGKWPTYEIKYLDDGREKTMELPMTFVDFAVTEARFRKHFKNAPPDTWNDDMVPIAEFIELDKDERDGKYPYVWAVDRKQNLSRLLVAQPLVESTEDRQDFWIMLQALAGVEKDEAPAVDLETKIRTEVVQKIATSLMQLAGGEGTLSLPSSPEAGTGAILAVPPSPENGNYMAPWIDTDQCTACDECTTINPKIFEYNASKKAVIKDPLAGPYRDLVKSAEKCTATVIHPGLPANLSEKNIEKGIKRGDKYN